MHAVNAILLRLLTLMFGIGMGGCALALLIAMATGVRATVAESIARHRDRGVRRYRCFFLALVPQKERGAFTRGHA